MRIKIEITETLQRVIEIEANSIDEAVGHVRKLYSEENIVLDNTDHVDTEIKIFSHNLNL